MKNKDENNVVTRAHYDFVVCYEKLGQLEAGDTVTYEDLTAAMGRDVKEHRSGLDRARRHLEREGKVIVCLRGIGYRRALPTDSVRECVGAVQGVAKKAKRALLRASHAQTEAMSQDHRVEHAVHAAVLANTINATTKIAIGKARDRVVETSKQIYLPENMIGGAK